LSDGERLATLAGPTAVLGIQPQHTTGQHKPQTVYNLEVQGQHVFRVTSNGLLVHNDCPTRTGYGAFEWGKAPKNKIDELIDEMLAGRQRIGVRRIDSKHTLTEDEALEAGIQFPGPGYREIGQRGSGVYRNGQRQFRMDQRSLNGDHEPFIPHVHLETFRGGRKPFVNNIYRSHHD
jgi:hypothetical protein